MSAAYLRFELLRTLRNRRVLIFSLAFPIVNPASSLREKLRALGRSAPFYAGWYPSRWLAELKPVTHGEFGKLARHLRFAEHATNHLGRSIFHAMVRFGTRLERRQMVLFRAVDIGADLFAIAAVCVRARMLEEQGRSEAVDLADVFCRAAAERIGRNLRILFGRGDVAAARGGERGGGGEAGRA